jgi:DNA-binding HxlR family transcriptional regulator
METKTPAEAEEIAGLCEDLCEGLTEAQEELGRELMERIAGKWPLWVLYVLASADAPLRFSRVLERVEGVSQKMLTQTLRQLERDGLISRTLYPQVPPRVDYALTSLGRDLLLQIMPLGRWITDHIGAFEAARQYFDQQKAGSKAK